MTLNVYHGNCEKPSFKETEKSFAVFKILGGWICS